MLLWARITGKAAINFKWSPNKVSKSIGLAETSESKILF